MKKKVKMICILKSGVKILETIKVHKKDLKVVNEMIKEIESYMSSSNPGAAQITWGHNVIRLSEVAAISFKD
jgi:hypothetical protein